MPGRGARMAVNRIDELCEKLIRTCGSCDPFEIAAMLGVLVEYDRMGSLKGYYSYMNRCRLIVINEKLSERLKKVVCAHELGHDRLHYNTARVSPLRDEGLFSSAKPEIEANRFAAELLVPTGDFVELASYGYTEEQIAGELNTYPELVRIKIRTLSERGFQLRIPDMPPSDFLARIK